VFERWPIRVKLLVGLGLLVLLVAILAGGSLHTTYAYRSLVKSLSWRVPELRLAAELSEQVGEARITLSELQGLHERHARSDRHTPHAGGLFGDVSEPMPTRIWAVREQFRLQLDQVETKLAEYRDALEEQALLDRTMVDNEHEWATVHQIEEALAGVRDAENDRNWISDAAKVDRLDGELDRLQRLVADLPSHLRTRLENFAGEVKGRYRTLIVGSWTASVAAAAVFFLLLRLFYQWIFRPLRVLIDGSRRVASGQFGYRIHLDTRDEMAELAEALNAMTARFQAIRDDLDRQVQERTKQVVRSEQLASVGFLAAGVAHEINNPLASIAMCAESLEGRIGEALDGSADEAGRAVIRNYLQMIQTEAFRCKEITERLLDFSRLGNSQRQAADLGDLVQGVVDMVGHLGKYQRRNIQFPRGAPVVALVNPQEIKQVVLNLLTNALESLDEGGIVRIRVERREEAAELVFADDGCGIEPHVLEHVFEPFFTRRRAGQGTGLGLSIAYRIVADHGGEIEAESPGPGCGATFRVRLPLRRAAAEQQLPVTRWRAA
jgi:two-component system, NtrC family, sensor kinase